MAKGDRSQVRVAGVISRRGKRRLDGIFRQRSRASRAAPSVDPTTSAIRCSRSLVTGVPWKSVTDLRAHRWAFHEAAARAAARRAEGRATPP